MRVTKLTTTPVKGTALHFPDVLHLGLGGDETNRRYYLIDAKGLMVNGKRHGSLVRVRAEYTADPDTLSLRFSDGTEAAGSVPTGGKEVETSFYGRPVRGRLLDGPWAEPLSEHLGRPVRLVACERPGEAVDVHPVTIVSAASIEALGTGGGVDGLDPRRFRMLIEVEGCAAYAEDTWAGSTVAVGEAVVRVEGPVPRCVVTTQNPDTGITNLPTLRMLLDQRGARVGDALDTPVDHLPDGGKLCMGVYGTVARPGRVRVGDELRLA